MDIEFADPAAAFPKAGIAQCDNHVG